MPAGERRARDGAAARAQPAGAHVGGERRRREPLGHLRRAPRTCRIPAGGPAGPPRTSSSIARRSVIRATPSSRASSRSAGSGSPGDSVCDQQLEAPRAICAASRLEVGDAVMDHWYSRSTGARQPTTPGWTTAGPLAVGAVERGDDVGVRGGRVGGRCRPSLRLPRTVRDQVGGVGEVAGLSARPSVEPVDGVRRIRRRARTAGRRRRRRSRVEPGDRAGRAARHAGGDRDQRGMGVVLAPARCPCGRAGWRARPWRRSRCRRRPRG